MAYAEQAKNCIIIATMTNLLNPSRELAEVAHRLIVDVVGEGAFGKADQLHTILSMANEAAGIRERFGAACGNRLLLRRSCRKFCFGRLCRMVGAGSSFYIPSFGTLRSSQLRQ